jgi:acylphosphatase
MTVNEIRLTAIVTGRVQGVYFRAYAQREAARLGVQGYTLNRIDGSVEVLAEGERGVLEQLLTWLQHGSPNARVAHITAEWGQATGEFISFEVRP